MLRPTKPLLWLLFLLSSLSGVAQTARPNILMVISDDQSWPHAGAYGTHWVFTPAFDQLASEGVLFHNAFVSAPSCAPSRLSILTGRHFYQNQEGGVHGGFIPSKFPLYTNMLENHGYYVGYTGKGCGPFYTHQEYGLKEDPLGKKYNDSHFTEEPIIHSFGNLDYAANFEKFLTDAQGKPFCFTFNCWEPHRPYHDSSGTHHGKDPQKIQVPSFLPDVFPIRNELNDYALEIDYYDQQLAKIIALLKQKGLYENTLIVVTSDNGMPFPNAKMHGYEYGTHVPFLVCWPQKIPPSPARTELILVPEVAGFFLEAAGVEVPVSMMNSTLPGLLKLKGFTMYPPNPFVVWGKEKHNPAREDNLGYPIRAIRTKDYLLVKNYEPSRWPAGDPPYYKDLLWEEHEVAMQYELDHQTDPTIAPFFASHTQKRPALELYDIRKDPFCLTNLATQKKYTMLVKHLSAQLAQKLQADGDPRAFGNGAFFDSTPTSFTNPKDDKTGQPIFRSFPAKRKYLEGMAHFDHSQDKKEAELLRTAKKK